MTLVLRQLWKHLPFFLSHQETDLIQIPHKLFERFIDTACYAL
jgi:hypothetical protein